MATALDESDFCAFAKERIESILFKHQSRSEERENEIRFLG